MPLNRSTKVLRNRAAQNARKNSNLAARFQQRAPAQYRGLEIEVIHGKGQAANSGRSGGLELDLVSEKLECVRSGFTGEGR